MLVSKNFVVFFFLCFVQNCLSKPATGNEPIEGRGIWSYIWGGITYPFSWSSGETKPPVAGPLLGSTTNYPNDIVYIRSHNVTIWCNDQICNTMKCDKTQCRNITCNIYDTDFRGECREYNTITDSEKHTVRNSTEATPKEIVPSKPTETYNVTPLANNTQNNDKNSVVEEHPLKLEKVLSSTVNQLNLVKQSESKQDPTIHETQVSNTPKKYNNSEVEEHPLKLGKVRSSTVKQLNLVKHSESKQDPTNHETQVSNTKKKYNNSAVKEHPLKPEKVISSTVNYLNLVKHSESKEDPTIPESQVSNTPKNDHNFATEEHPLKLEKVLLSTVNPLNLVNNSESKEDLTMHTTQV